MNVYWVGTEDIDFTLGPNAAGTTNLGWDTNWNRCAISINTGGTTWPLASYAVNPTSFGNLSSFWVHDYFWMGNTSLGANIILFALADAGGVGRILIRCTGTGSNIKISTRNAAGTITDLSTTGSGTLTNGKLDIFVNYSTSGQITVYSGGVAVCDTGPGVNVTTDSATSLSFLYLSAGLGNATGYEHSQVVVADSDTRNVNVWTLNSSTAGNAQTWAGTATSVNKALQNDATFISAASAGLINEYKSGGIALPSGTYTVATVKMSMRALGASSAPTKVEYVTRVGSTDFTGGQWTPVPGSFGNDTQNYMQATNPGTSLAWTTADLTASTFNYGVESVT